MTCNEFSELIKEGPILKLELQNKAVDHVRLCQLCRNKYSPVSDLILDENDLPVRPQVPLKVIRFWLIFIPSLLSIFALLFYFLMTG